MRIILMMVILCLLLLGCDVGHISALMKKHKNNDEVLKEKITECEKIFREVFSNGDYTEYYKSLGAEEKNELDKERFKLESYLEKKLPYVYWEDGNEHNYADRYGSTLMVVSLQDLKEAIIKQQAEEINTGNFKLGYGKYDMALRMIEGFMNSDFWDEKYTRVIMWGH